MHLTTDATRIIERVNDVPSDAFIQAYAKHLKESGKMCVPKWTEYSKTSGFKKLAPFDPDYVYVRAASILRRFAIGKPTNVNSFRHHYGGALRRGVQPNKHMKAGVKLIKFCIRELEKLQLVKVETPGSPKKITRLGLTSAVEVAKQCVA